MLGGLAGLDVAWLPYYVFFSGMTIFHLELPNDTAMEPFGEWSKISEKAPAYIFAAIVASRSKETAVVSALGALVGYVYYLNLLRVQSLRIPLPSVLASMLTTKIGFQASPALPRAPPPPSRPSPPFAPNEEHIQVLVSLGFPRERAVSALRSSGNNLEAASNLLLDGRA